MNTLRDKGVQTITTDDGGLFREADVEKIDYVAQANTLFDQQKGQRLGVSEDIAEQQSNIDNYRSQAQETINAANIEIKRLQQSSTGDADVIVTKTEEFNLLIDTSYDIIDDYKNEMFESKQIILTLEREVGPIKYIAEVIYGQEDSVKYLDNAVRWVIYMLIFVFDPLAILLLVTSLGLIQGKGKTKKLRETQRIVLQVPKKKMQNLQKN